MNKTIQVITQRIIERSSASRADYLKRMSEQAQLHPAIKNMGCGNLAHTVAAANKADKQNILSDQQPNIAIVSAYNDMLSAHKPYEEYPQQIRQYSRQLGASAQVAGMVPAMCDGITQGRAGMRLSLFSRDMIAMGTAVSLSHNVYHGAICLGVCDKIVPGLLLGALNFGHLPTVFLPAGPMSTGQSNSDKAKVRQAFTTGEASKADLLASECTSYHGVGTCTFYGTANTNQMILEIMGLQLPSSSFEHPQSKYRNHFNSKAIRTLIESIRDQQAYSLAEIVDEKCIVNALVGLLATGGSTNLSIHMIAIAKAAGILINWQDISDLSEVVPLLCRIYPNGSEDVNAFHNAGGMAFVIYQLLTAGLLHPDVKTMLGDGLANYGKWPEFSNSSAIIPTSEWSSAHEINWSQDADTSSNHEVITTVDKAFSNKGGLQLLKGNLGRAIIKVSAVAKAHQTITAPARVFRHQKEFIAAYKNNELFTDFIAVIRFQGPKTNGMPELHQLTPILGVLIDNGHKVAMVTDGRMSGASGKVPAAIHLVPEAADGGLIAKVQDGDLIQLDCQQGTLALLVENEQLIKRDLALDLEPNKGYMGEAMFQVFRNNCSNAEQGATIL